MIKSTSSHKAHNEMPIRRYSYQKENVNCTNKTGYLPIEKIVGNKICDDLEARKVQKQSKINRFD